MSQTITQIMEQASQSLAKMAYRQTQTLCLEALEQARNAQDWALYQRILLPLQEARRQIRMNAGDGVVLIGGEYADGFEAFTQGQIDGCLFIADDQVDQNLVNPILDAAERTQRNVEVLVGAAQEQGWQVRSFLDHINVKASIDEPADDWVGHINRTVDSGLIQVDQSGHSPLGWFLKASEQLGDALIERAMDLEGHDRFIALEEGLKIVPDHELLHQALNKCADVLRRIR